MVSCREYSFIFIFLLSSLISFGQKEIDTLYSKSFDDLLNIYNSEPSFKMSELYIKVWLKKAKKENDIPQLLTGYEIASLLYDNEKSLEYYDSILSISLKNKKYNDYSVSAYRMKGEYFYNKRDFKRELKNYLLAKKYTNKKGESVLECLLEFNIGVVKNRIHEHEQALDIHKKNFPLAKKLLKGKFNYSYIQSIYAIANTYNYLNILDSALYYNRFGVKEALYLNEIKMINYFTLNQGITHYLKGESKISIDSLKKAFMLFKNKNDYPNISEASYYLGKSYEKMGDLSLAKRYYRKVDTIFRKTNDLLPILRSTYDFLIEDAQNNNNLKEQIDYTNQLIKLDSILYSNEIYVNKNIINDYDIPKLISTKEQLIRKLKSKEKSSKLFFVFLFVIIFVISIIAFYQKNKTKKYKKRFEEILTTKNKKSKKNKINTEINIPKEKIDIILEKIKLFESQQKFISNRITLRSLAEDFNTNTNYLSKIINYYKNESFSSYLSNLRIEYIISRLKTDAVIRKYTIKAIAKEAGFNNSESFSKTFYKTKGIKPSFFLRELEKINDLN
ncbi:MAG: helix-turn-helix domain-containing protein [Polaribacter sp.]|nr:helix-turn-helix domain-containing protein [Polaribacter sp.]